MQKQISAELIIYHFLIYLTVLYLLGLIVVIIILVVVFDFPVVVGGGGMLLFAVVMASIKTPAVIRKRNQRPLEVLIIASNFTCRQ